MEGESSCKEEEFCKVQVNLVCLEDDIGNVQEDDALDKLASFLYSRNDKVDKKIKRYNLKVRKFITTKGLVRGKNQCDKGKD